jgi:hypothetical protein
MHLIQELRLCMKGQVDHEPNTIYLLFYQYQANPIIEYVNLFNLHYKATHKLTVKMTLGRLPSLEIVSKRETASSLPTISFK